MTGQLLTIPAAEYHADPCDTPSLSASVARVLIAQSPAHARHAHPRLNPNFARDDDPKFDLGTVVHAILLEGVDPLNVVEVCEFDSWRSGAAKEAAAAARAAGKIPLLGGHYFDVLQMVDAVRVQLLELDVSPRPFTAGQPEKTIVWEDRGVQCRARLDWLRDDCSHVFDLKTTSRIGGANPKVFERAIFSMGYDLQAAFYTRAVRAVTGLEPQWRWVVAETCPPYAVTVIQPDDDTLAIGNAKVERALEVWQECLATDCWPAYSTTVETVTAPAWETAWLLTPELEESAWAAM